MTPPQAPNAAGEVDAGETDAEATGEVDGEASTRPTGARIAPGTLRQLGLPAYAFTRLAGLVTHTPPPAVFTTLGRTRGLFWGWLHFAGRLMPFGTLSRRESELVILRVAHLRGSAYEWAHHAGLGRKAGITAEELRLLAADAQGFPKREQLMLDTAAKLLRDKDLDDPSWAALRSVLDERETIEFLLLAGHYDMLATTLQVLRVSPD